MALRERSRGEPACMLSDPNNRSYALHALEATNAAELTDDAGLNTVATRIPH